MKKIDLLIDRLGSGDNIFEIFATEFENSQIKGDWNISMQDLQKKVELVERKLQDISEKITVLNENKENIYEVIIQKTKELLSFWLPIFSNRNLAPDSSSFFSKELDKLLVYLDMDLIERKNIQEITNDFEKLFTINSKEIKSIANEISPLSAAIKGISSGKINEFTNDIINSLYNIVKNRAKDYEVSKSFMNETNFPKTIELIKSKIAELENSNSSDEVFEGDKDAIYTAELKLWINTRNVAEANRFVSIVTSVFGLIEDVNVTIIDSGFGSYWQRIKITAHGWFAKEETKQILKKGKNALEAYVLDRHIEPIEKSISDKKKPKQK